MEESLKKLVYAGVGFAAQATEKFEKSIQELVKKGKIEEKEGKKIVNDFLSKSEKTKSNFEAKLKKTVEDVVSTIKVKTPGSDIKDLTKRIAALEKELGKKTPKAKAKTTAKKTVRKAKSTVKKTTAAAKKTVNTAKKGVSETVATAKA